MGTGHDFLNRHSCNGEGILIRTTLLKGAVWDLNDSRGFGSPGGSVRVGAGMTFSELAYEARTNGRVVSQGWGITVGIVGWSLGGGHGPFANSLGMGVDNILEVRQRTSCRFTNLAPHLIHISSRIFTTL